MILCIDIGNTNISLGVLNEKNLILKLEIPTALVSDEEKMRLVLKKFFRKRDLHKEDFETVIICSVVPKSTKAVKNILKRNFGIKCIELGKEIKAPIKNRYLPPEKVGQDRLANAVAAVRLYGKPSVIIDFGTCVTFDCISSKGEYLGGLIMPGIEMVLDVLYRKTALLPKTQISFPKALIGRDTKESIKSGIYNGLLGACDFVIRQIKGKLGSRTLVIATGGYAELFRDAIKSIDIFNSNLTLQGLYLICSEKDRKR